MADKKLLLSIRNITVFYDAIRAINKVSFDVYEGEIVTLIGGNGAGKSTVLRSISGLVPYSGEIIYNEKNLKNIPANKIVGLGIAHVPEGRCIFGNLTVLENLKLATWNRNDKKAISEDLEKVFGIFPRLKERMKQMSTTLSGGEQQMLALGRALMSKSKILLLDEPSMGLSPVLVRDIFKVLVEINRSGTTIVLVEQNAHMALQVSNRGYVLETGNITLSGTGQELSKDTRVKEAYLGG